MEKKTYNIYKYDELTEDQKEKAFECFYNINIDHDWWEFYPEDSAIELKGFDIYRGDIKIDFAESAQDTAAYIITNHGEKCDTYVTSAHYKKQDDELAKRYDELEKQYQAAEEEEKRDKIAEEQDDIDDKRNELAREYRDELAQDILSLLRKEYDYLTSREAIEETIRANDYDFTEDGSIA